MRKHMKKFFYLFSLLGAFLLLMQAALSVQAAPQPQGFQFATPTAGPDGRIVYIVQPGDTCLRVSLLTGISTDELRSLNRLDENCALREGQELLLGFGGPAAVSPTPGPSPTPTPILPTPTPVNSGTGEVCVLLYNDLNGDSLRQEKEDELGTLPDGSEPAIEGGAVSLAGRTGAFSDTLNTEPGLYPICFTDVPPGDYNVSVAIPDGYNPTTSLSNSFEVTPGDSIYIAFGAQERGFGTIAGEGDDGGSSILGWVGGLLLFGGLGLGFFATRMRKGTRKVQLPTRR